MKANLQDTQQMKQFLEQFKEEYERGISEQGARVEADEESVSRS